MTNKVTVDEKIKIRQAEIKDVERIASLCEQLEYSVTNQQIEQRLTKIKNNDTHIVYVALRLCTKINIASCWVTAQYKLFIVIAKILTCASTQPTITTITVRWGDR
ncbi:hypothetical protein [Nostoc sp.]|uniref:hypothetical protein n=1 Tax=Nostoc sp. TaxID=1180 RepID=UPI002FFB4CEC